LRLKSPRWLGAAAKRVKKEVADLVGAEDKRGGAVRL
jgi:hypothetical protein